MTGDYRIYYYNKENIFVSWKKEDTFDEALMEAVEMIKAGNHYVRIELEDIVVWRQDNG